MIPSYPQEEERVFLNLLQARKPAPEPEPEFIPRINPEPTAKHESVARGDIEKTVWAMRRRGHEPRADAKPGTGQKKVDHYNIDFGMQKDTSIWKKGDPQHPVK